MCMGKWLDRAHEGQLYETYEGFHTVYALAHMPLTRGDKYM